MKFLAGFLFFSGTLAFGASPLDDTVRAFEDALKSAPPASVRPGMPPLSDLEPLLHRPGSETDAEQAISRIIAYVGSEPVHKTASALIDALEQQRKANAQMMVDQLRSVLDQTKDIIIHAQHPSDLDDLIQKLLTFTASPQWNAVPDQSGRQELIDRMNTALHFATAWQDYLSALASGRKDDQAMYLRIFLNEPQLLAMGIFPRSFFLERINSQPVAGPAPNLTTEQPPPIDPIAADDAITQAVHKVDDVDAALNKLAQVPRQSLDFSDLSRLEHERDDAVAGLPFTFDFPSAINGRVMGDDISRIEGMELLVIVPIYLGTQVSNPPQANESLLSYLDRICDAADEAGDLVLLQRALSVKVGLAQAERQSDGNNAYGGTSLFLVGLGLEADGLYGRAAASYAQALQQYDPLLPVKILGRRLAGIKKAHRDEFKQGLAGFGGELNGAYTIPTAVQVPARTSGVKSSGKKKDGHPSNSP